MEKHKFVVPSATWYPDKYFCQLCSMHKENKIYHLPETDNENIGNASEPADSKACLIFAEKSRVASFSGKVNKLGSDGKCQIFEPRPVVRFWIQKSTVRQLSGWDLVITADEQQVKVLLSFEEFEQLQAVGVPVREGGENVKV